MADDVLTVAKEITLALVGKIQVADSSAKTYGETYGELFKVIFKQVVTGVRETNEEAKK